MTSNNYYTNNNDIYKNERDYEALEGVPLIESSKKHEQSTTKKKTADGRHQQSYPGNRRSVLPASGPPADSVLVTTAGNALQAVPRQLFDNINESNNNIMAVSVPENLGPGDTLLVQTPEIPPQVIEAVVPASSYPGSTFFVEIPPIKTTPVVSVTGVAVPEGEQAGVTTTTTTTTVMVPSSDLHLDVEHPQQQQSLTHLDDSSNLVLAQVPPGVAPGSTIRVDAPDGRTVEATVPAGVTQFYVRVPPPPTNNAHDNHIV